MRPEGYDELDEWMNQLSATSWLAILHAKHIGGDERVVGYLRRMTDDLCLWSDEELLEYLIARDLKEDYTTMKERM